MLGNSAKWTRNFGIRVASCGRYLFVCLRLSCVYTARVRALDIYEEPCEATVQRAVRLFSKDTAIRWPNGCDIS